MKHARIRHHGQVFNVQVDEQLRVTLPNGEVLQEREVEWLPPAQSTVFALGLNYADHASELAFKAPSEEPLVFIKAPNTFTGHRQVSVAPGQRRVHALRSRAGGGDRQDRAQRQPRARHGLRGGLHGVQRLRHPRLPGELLPAQPAGEEPRRPDPDGAVHRRSRMTSPSRTGWPCAPASTASCAREAAPRT